MVVQLGDLELWAVEDVRWRLDGGMMFGTLPRVIWERTAPPDQRNRVRMALRNLLIRGRDRDGRPAVVLVDAGLGEMAVGAKFRELYAVSDEPWRLLAEMAAAGVAPADVTHVVYTHLHFDHVAGGVRADGMGAAARDVPGAADAVRARADGVPADAGGVRRGDGRARAGGVGAVARGVHGAADAGRGSAAGVLDDAGGVRPTFPRARYVVHGDELAYAKAPDRRSRASYLPETWQPLEDAGVLDTVSGRHEVIPGVTLHDAPGHTDHHQVVTVTGGGRTVLFTADLFPFASHLKPHYVPALDVDPRRTMESRQRYLERVTAENWLLLFQHDPDYGLVKVERDLTVTAVAPNGSGRV